MKKANNVIDFIAKVKENENNEEIIEELNSREDCITYPTEKEIRVMNALLEKYTSNDPDVIVPFNMWNGDCMHSIFDEMSEYAKEIDVDPWDAFALFIQKLHGWRMEETEDGVVVRYKKE